MGPDQILYLLDTSAVTILKSKTKIVVFLSESAKIEFVIFAKSLLQFIFAAIIGCCWIKAYTVVIVVVVVLMQVVVVLSN